MMFYWYVIRNWSEKTENILVDKNVLIDRVYS